MKVEVLVINRRSPYFGQRITAHWYGVSWVSWYDGGYNYLGPGDFVVC